MLTRRRLLICLLIATLLIVPVAGWVVWREITKPEPVRAYERLRLGMTHEEVQTAIGAPQEDFDLPWGDLTIIREIGLPSAHLRDLSGFATGDQWFWDDFCIWVVFDDRGQAVGLYLIDTGNRPPSVLEQLRAWVGL
jgi:hypothetical protein